MYNLSLSLSLSVCLAQKILSLIIIQVQLLEESVIQFKTSYRGKIITWNNDQVHCIILFNAFSF